MAPSSPQRRTKVDKQRSDDSTVASEGGASDSLTPISDSVSMDQAQRSHEQREIHKFIDQAFSEVKKFTLQHYIHFNSMVSSEMFMAVMTVLQERLPCAAFYFRQRRQFKFAMLGSGSALDGQSDSPMQPFVRNSGPMGSSRGYSAHSKGQGKDMISQVTAIVQPRIISGFSPSKRQSSGRLTGFNRNHRNLCVDDSPVRKGQGSLKIKKADSVPDPSDFTFSSPLRTDSGCLGPA